jgi:hypothetical protein
MCNAAWPPRSKTPLSSSMCRAALATRALDLLILVGQHAIKLEQPVSKPLRDLDLAGPHFVGRGGPGDDALGGSTRMRDTESAASDSDVYHNVVSSRAHYALETRAQQASNS